MPDSHERPGVSREAAIADDGVVHTPDFGDGSLSYLDVDGVGS